MGSKKQILGFRSNSAQLRYFSESFRRKKVLELEENKTRVCDVCREYNVSSTSVYKWIDKYSSLRTKGVRQVVEVMSDTQKIRKLKDQIAELERLVGQKQVELEFRDKLIELAETFYRVDIKKKFGSRPSSGSGKTDSDTD
ncbi:MAG TPA: transposase [Pseudosphingobacterium sp.]|nr:transposase [Pseudosphingobacterium sp.]